MPLQSTNPSTGELIGSYAEMNDVEVEERLRRATAAAAAWRRTSVTRRSEILGRLARVLEEDAERLAVLATQEMGKLLGAAREEVRKCASTCRYYASHGERFLAAEPVSSDGVDQGWVVYEPLGVVLAVMPWNFPFWQVIRCVAPAITAGNVVLLKHAANVTGCALALEQAVAHAGGGDHLLQTVLVSSGRVAGLIADRRIAAVSLTGSVAAGREVGAAAGRRLIPSVLELGGSDAFVVMPSVDPETTAAAAVRARTINNGESCIAAKRFIVASAVHDRFVSRFVELMQALRVGDPAAPDTELGPLVSARAREQLDDQVKRSVAAGARLLCGGQPMPGPGFFYAPTVLADVPPGCPAWREELFGPVAAVRRAADIDEAIALANDSELGLGASAWTADGPEAERLASELRAGTVFINGMVASDPRFPFGGTGDSGYGRELGLHGLRELTSIKTVRMFPAPGAPPLQLATDAVE